MGKISDLSLVTVSKTSSLAAELTMTEATLPSPAAVLNSLKGSDWSTPLNVAAPTATVSATPR